MKPNEVVTDSKFMYMKTDNGLEIYMIVEDMKISENPVSILGKSEIAEIGKSVPNMYYPLMDVNAPIEVKAAYKKLKDGYGDFIPEENWIVGLYNDKKKLLGHLQLLSGR